MRRKRLRIFFVSLLAILLVMQAFRPKRNDGDIHGPQSLATAHPIPPGAEAVLKKACYDCHSNHTSFPWYANIQPIGWWMQHHVNEGKEHLNFSEWTTYSPKKQAHKLEETREEVEEGHMPISSYTWVHGGAKLSPAEKDTLLNWARRLEASLRG